MTKDFYKLSRVVTFLALFFCLKAAVCSDEDSSGVLKVLIHTFPPFVQAGERGFEGFDIELWETIARQEGLEFKFESVPSLSLLLNRISKGEADAGLAGITINNAREAFLDFSHSYFSTGLGILIPAKPQSRLSLIGSSLWTPATRRILFGLFLFIIICSHLIWFFERGKDAISDNYWPGIFEGAWWTIVTMSTVGYGDIAPKKWFGRITAVFVIITGIAFFGIAIAELSSSFAMYALKGQVLDIEDLKNNRVAVVEGTTSQISMIKRNISAVLCRDFSSALEAVNSGRADALVSDLPLLKYFIKSDNGRGYEITGSSFEPQNYGIVMPEGSDLRERLNRRLLKIMESPKYRLLVQRWIDSEF